MLINFANADIVAHTGNEKATILAVETVDRCLGKIIPEILKKNGCLLITADHGNAEELRKRTTGETDTEHSENPVPLWFVTADNNQKGAKEKFQSYEAQGILSDVAPTILKLLGLEKPKDMTGESLLPLLK